MVEPVEITDRESAQAWLAKQDHQTQVWFAARCALRALPGLAEWQDATSSGLALATCRAGILSMAAAMCPAAKLRNIKDSAELAEDYVGDTIRAIRVHMMDDLRLDTKTPAYAAAEFARATASASYTAAHGPRSGHNSAAKAAEISALRSSNAAWQAASLDANSPMGWTKLWPGGRMPEYFRAGWQALKTQWGTDPDWSFWIKWYDSILNGTPMDWEICYRIAVETGDQVWAAGPANVAKRIREIQTDILLNSLPQVNDVYETEDGLYEIRGTTLDTSKLMQSVLDRVSFALDTAVKSNSCDLNEMSLACRILREALAIGEGDANAVEQYLRRASALIKSGVESGKYADDDETSFLIGVLDETALQLRGDHPEVAEATATRLATSLREIDGEKRLKMAQLIDDMREGTGPRLNAGLGLAAEVTRDGSSSEATADAVKESGNVAGKIGVLERAKRVEGSGQMAMTKMAVRAQHLVDWVVGLISGSG